MKTSTRTPGLIECVPNINLDQEELVTMPGSPPDLVTPPDGCPFAERCQYVLERCHTQMPVLSERSDGHTIACWLYTENWEPPWES